MTEKEIYLRRLVEWEVSLDTWLSSLWIDAAAGNADEDWEIDFAAWTDSLAAWTSSAEAYLDRHGRSGARILSREEAAALFEEDE